MAQALIGLDIGYLHLRAVRLEQRKDGWHCTASAEVPRFDDQGSRKALPVALAEIDGRIDLKKGDLTVAASDLAVMVRFEANDPMPPDRLERVLRLELSQASGLEGDGDLAADAIEVPIDGDKVIHCCGLAQTVPAIGLLTDLANQGIKPRRLQLTPAGLANVLDALPEDDGALPFRLLVDIGARSTRVVLSRGRDFLACRQLPTGGDLFTEQLAKVRSLRFDEAETLKVEGGDVSAALDEVDDRLELDESGAERAATAPGPAPALWAEDRIEVAVGGAGDAPPPPAADQPGAAAGAVPGVDGDDGAGDWRRSGVIPTGVPEPLAPGVPTQRLGVVQLGPDLQRIGEDLYTQLAKTLSWFQTQLRLREMPVREILLVGGGSELIGLQPYLQRRFGRPVRRFDAFATIAGEPPADRVRFAQALGLALAGRPEAVVFDLRPESLQRREIMRETVLWPRVAAALLLVAAAVLCFGFSMGQDADQARIEAYQRQAADHANQQQRLDALRGEEIALKQDLRAVASRIFAGRDLLDTIRALKMHAPETLWITKLSTRDLSGDVKVTTGADVDLTIDRGSVYLDGFVRPESEFDFDRLFSYIQDWYRSLKDYETVQRQAQLFADYKFIDGKEHIWQLPDDQEERGWEFRVRFDFRPTTIDEWVDSGAPLPERP